MAIKPGSRSWPNEAGDDGSENLPLGAERLWIEGCYVVAGVKIAETKLKRVVNTSLRIERLLKDSFSMDRGGQGRWKEKKKIRRRLGKKKQ